MLWDATQSGILYGASWILFSFFFSIFKKILWNKLQVNLKSNRCKTFIIKNSIGNETNPWLWKWTRLTNVDKNMSQMDPMFNKTVEESRADLLFFLLFFFLGGGVVGGGGGH